MHGSTLILKKMPVYCAEELGNYFETMAKSRGGETRELCSVPH